MFKRKAKERMKVKVSGQSSSVFGGPRLTSVPEKLTRIIVIQEASRSISRWGIPPGRVVAAEFYRRFFNLVLPAKLA